MRPSGRGGRLALLPFFVALIAYGGTKQRGGVESGGVGSDQILLRRYAFFHAVELISFPKVIFRC